ncbi:hypothetical protein RJ641_022311 [Dillenia turbinata]|uniref:Uncharacterized protein n=1 Tax=Dillenia turbinata TaxID=194707 RepID=A0AAN8UC72_9MAGN
METGSVDSSVNDRATDSNATITTSEISDLSQKFPSSTQRRTSGPARRSTKGQWTPEEDEILCKAVQHFKGKNWKKIAECFKDRTDVQCLHRWQKVLNPELVKGPWTKEEDNMIVKLVEKYGAKKWSTIAQCLPGRIGKQCRERSWRIQVVLMVDMDLATIWTWHNHLNPAINKEAWTVEEELALIRAHQIYGNKWAELSKFLPGRTDNAIKNHWNSSVKRKLNSYLTSGMLLQFPVPPQAGYQDPSMPTACSRPQQSSIDESCKTGKAQPKEISDYSQGSIIVCCSQLRSSMMNTNQQTRELQTIKEFGQAGKYVSSPASCSEQFYASVEDADLAINELPHGSKASSMMLEQNFSNDNRNLECEDCEIWSSDVPGISSAGPRQIIPELPAQISGPSKINDLSYAQHGTNPEHLSSQGSCCGIFAEGKGEDCFPNGNHTKCSDDVKGCSAPLLCQSPNFQISESSNGYDSESHNPLDSDVLRTSCDQNFHPPFHHAQEPGQPDGALLGTQEHELVTTSSDRFIYPSTGEDDEGMQEQYGQANQAPKLVPVDPFNSELTNTGTTLPSAVECSLLQNEQKETGALFYEPPCFPILDIPFLSCDLIQSPRKKQEFSPLGIRQLLISSVNGLNPFSLLDSPTGDCSPDIRNRTAAKSFICTPSILKKRHHDAVSPFSAKRNGRKVESGKSDRYFCTSSLSNEFSCVDFIFNEATTGKASLSSPSQTTNFSGCKEDKENVDYASAEGQQENKVSAMSLQMNIPVKEFPSNKSEDKIKAGDICCTGVEDEAANHIVRSRLLIFIFSVLILQSPEVLAEYNLNDLDYSSPGQFVRHCGRLNANAEAAGGQIFRGLHDAKGNPSLSRSPNMSVLVSPAGYAKHESHLGSITPAQIVSSSTPKGPCVRSAAWFNPGASHLNIFGETPFRRGIESPSAWKSPWFFHSFMPGPKIDTDITIEDIGYLMSPGNGSYDAIGLMKQLSEHTAGVLADAREILGVESPDTILKERLANRNLEENNFQDSRPAAMSEHRALDFSECATPEKQIATEKSPSTSSVSPSSYLIR